MQDLLNAFNFLSANIHLAGWVFLMGIVWKISKFFNRLTEASEEAKDAAARTKRMETTIESVATNHLPHLQEGINEVNGTLKDLHRDIVTVLLHKLNKE
jgi:hypothetical protein